MVISWLANWKSLSTSLMINIFGIMGLYNTYGIYGIKNTVNGKIYVGKTMQSFGDRWDCHKAQLKANYHDNRHLQNAWNKYGSENFEFIILQDCTDKDLDYVNTMEIAEIKKYKDLGLAYNIHDGGDGGLFLGKHLSEEAKRKIGEKNRINMTGKKVSLETRKKMSQSQKERYKNWTDDDRKEYGEKISQWSKGYTWSDESKQKMIGNKNGALYTIEQVKEIRRLRENEGLGYTDISKIMDIPRPAVYLIATYRRWKDV